MASGILSRDNNFIPTIGAVSSLDDKTVRSLQYDPTTRGLRVHFVGDDSGLATESTLEAIKDKVTEDVAQTLTYNADGTIATMVKVVGGVTYTKTFSYTDSNLTGISAWVAS